MALKAPHRRPGAAKTRLHLVGNEQPARCTNRRHGRGQKPRRIDKHPVGRKHRIHDQRRHIDAMALQIRNRCLHALGKHRPRIGPGSRRGHHPHMFPQIHPGAQAGRHARHRVSHAMISVFRHDKPGTPGMGAGNAKGQIIGL